MKCVVIYFSQTGNTEKIARAIQTGVKQIADHCDILPIKEANPRRLYEYDLIGLGSPVHGGVPGNITAFINNIRFVGGKHAFSFCATPVPYRNPPPLAGRFHRGAHQWDMAWADVLGPRNAHTSHPIRLLLSPSLSTYGPRRGYR